MSYLEQYRAKLNLIAIVFLWVHVPIMAGVAASFDTGVSFAAWVSALIAAGPLGIYLVRRESLVTSTAIAVASMCMSVLLIHLGRGTIEFHFHILVVLPMLVVFGNLIPLVAAGAVIAVHHAVFFMLLPASVFNYHASWGVVAMHAVFVIVEVASCGWVAVKFGRFIQAQALATIGLAATSFALSETAQTIRSGGDEVAESVRQQAASLATTSASASEVSAMTRKTAEHSRVAVSAAERMAEQTNTTTATLDEMVVSMQAIGDASKKIATIVKTSDELAFQSGILALNAAVEAARAGTAGVGFAVVADEVRILAQRSSQAARDTAALIEASVASTAQGRAKLASVVEHVRSIALGASEVRDSIQEMERSSLKQCDAIGQVSEALCHIGTLAQSHSISTERSITATQNLIQQATDLDQLVTELTVLVT